MKMRGTARARSGRRRGVYLATVLLVIVLLAMTLGAAVKVVEGTAVNGSARDVQAALDAASSGLRYARARLAGNYKWRGDGNGVMVEQPVSSPYLMVQEDDGNVAGIIKTVGGRYAQFRIRFNFQNHGTSATNDSQNVEDSSSTTPSGGWPTDDGFTADPTCAFTDDPYVSINNIAGMGSAPVFRADGTDASVTGSSKIPTTVPASTACIIVEGRAGPAMANLSPSNLNAAPIAGDHYSQKVVEAFFQAASGLTTNAALESGGDMTFNLQSGSGAVNVTTGNSQTPNIRSHDGDVTVTGGTAYNYVDRYVNSNGVTVSQDGDVYTKNGNSNTFSANPGNTVNVKDDSSAGDFYKLSWSDVRQATSSDPSLPAGTYVVNNSGQLVYYPMSYSNYTQYVNTNGHPPTAGTLNLPPDVKFVKTTDTTDGTTSYKLKITGNVNVTQATDTIDSGGGTVDDLAFIPEGGVQQAPTGPTGGGAGTIALPTSATYTPYSSSPSESRTVTWAMTQSPPTAALSALPASATSASGVTNWQSTDEGGFKFHLHYDPGAATNPYTLTFDDCNIPGPTSLPGPAIYSIVPYYSSPTPTQQSTLQTDGTNALNAVLAWYASSANTGDPTAKAVAQALLSGSGMQMNHEASGTSVRAGDMNVSFDPPAGKTAILTDGNGGNANIEFGCNVQGSGSITTTGKLSLVAPGTHLSSPKADGVSLYAKGDIDLSTLKQPLGGSATVATPTTADYNDFVLNGVIYTCGKFTCAVGYTDSSGHSANQWGSFNLKGALVAYGADDPDNDDPTKNGSVTLSAASAKIIYDSQYLTMMHIKTANPLTRTFYTQF